MSHHVLTEVSAVVDPARESALVAAFEGLPQSSFPDGLIRSELLRGADGEWRILTLWRDRAALEAMRSASEPPVAPTLFREVGAEPSLRVLDVAAEQSPAGVS